MPATLTDASGRQSFVARFRKGDAKKNLPIPFSAIKNGRIGWIDNQVLVKVE